ncbi:uncharacterized protein BXZ73DRAFT_100450 [Epithele typhae]|uniref:uncharacterized protein n=1 Tax=Epithele typhae TaxID=378194 RepID=UPI002008B713|nr:uncharacterized protein BXZ73DRAFT_100450 [Epithele typhae]KAH9935973.1 hypothetical protein BXZ73DRAFT_100450 [Epithele typhae]
MLAPPAPLAAYPAPILAHKHVPAAALYLHCAPTVEVIQLVEVPAPPPRSHPYSSSYASSSFASSSGSDSDSEQDESICSSYCSSDDAASADAPAPADDTYKTRITRVLAWRDGFTKALDADVDMPPAPPSSPVSSAPSNSSSRKRKADDDHAFDSDDDMSSRSSKRSRSLPPQERAPPSWQQRRFSAHSCSACDAHFATVQSLRQHGQEASINDACREAVEYGFEP